MVPPTIPERIAGTSERRCPLWSGTQAEEHREFDDDGRIKRRDANINHYNTEDSERRYR